VSRSEVWFCCARNVYLNQILYLSILYTEASVQKHAKTLVALFIEPPVLLSKKRLSAAHRGLILNCPLVVLATTICSAYTLPMFRPYPITKISHSRTLLVTNVSSSANPCLIIRLKWDFRLIRHVLAFTKTISSHLENFFPYTPEPHSLLLF
jgi:hypothetical protein